MTDINKMTPGEICKYLNSGNFCLPLIVQYLDDNGKFKYDVHYSVRVGFENEYRKTEGLDLDGAIKLYKEIAAKLYL